MLLRKTAIAGATLALAAAPMAMSMGSASAAEGGGTTTLWAKATQLNDSGASSTVTAWLTGNQLRIKMVSTGLLAGAPHAQHIHIGGSNQCPAPDAKGTGVDGHLRVADGMKSYGMIAVSLTKTGDSSPDSGLAVDRFPTGNETYERTLTVSDSVAKSLRNGEGVVVQHGVDYNGNGKYDGESKSELDPKLPEEATDPATCGVLEVSQMNSMPEGGVQTGGGSDNPVAPIAFAGGAAAVVLGGAGFLGMRRKNRANR
ncbi:hypothetical protein [Flexivirga meconopsidis]|uniref:hypothetical protein n=1 Tax=Flexivirga meconopsidis TaxID=2977121 RepID=UPI00223FEF2A|nr:hypothetical protein [Flexivirga meconopsidis]